MKRDQLKELGLSDEQIQSVMDLNGKDINKTKENLASLTTENESLKNQISDRDKDLKKFKSQVKDSEDLEKQITNWQAKYKKDTADLNAKLGQVKLNSAIDQSLSKSNARNIKAVKSLLNMDDVSIDDDGNLKGLDDQIKAIQKSDPYLFNEGEEQHYNPTNGKPPAEDPTQVMVDVFKGETE